MDLNTLNQKTKIIKITKYDCFKLIIVLLNFNLTHKLKNSTFSLVFVEEV